MRVTQSGVSGAGNGMDGVGRIIDKRWEERDGARTGDRRRDSLFMIAQLRLEGAGEAHEVRVRNLSIGGLMIEFDREVAAGAPVTLEMRGLGEVTGRVAWCTRGRVGIALDAPIDPKRVRKPVGAGRATSGFVPPVAAPRPTR